MPVARGHEGRWFADIDFVDQNVPCVHHWLVQPANPNFLYEDRWIGARQDPQKTPYIAAIRDLKRVIVAISFPNNPQCFTDGFSRAGYDALWTIIPETRSRPLWWCNSAVASCSLSAHSMA